MESYHGLILTPRDAMILLEAARIGMIPKTVRRLSEFERSRLITNGAIFIWDELESGMKRWTDGKSWSASRVSGSFLIYKEMENTKNYTFYNNSRSPSYMGQLSGPSGEESYRYKNNGLIKQSFSITLSNNAKLHLISYVNQSYLKKNQSYKDHQAAAAHQEEFLQRPTEDPTFKSLKFDPSLYPETILTYQDTIPDFQQVDSMKPASPNSNQKLQYPSTTMPKRENPPQSQNPVPSALQLPKFSQHQQAQPVAHTPSSSALTGASPSSAYRHFTTSPSLSGTNTPPAGQFHPVMYRGGSPATPYYPPPFPHQQQQQQQLPFYASAHQHQDQQQQAQQPLHHREDGRYLNMLDKRFSS